MPDRLIALGRRVADGLRPGWNRFVGWMEYKIDEPISNRRAAEILIGGLGAALAGGFLLIAMISLLVRGTITLGHTAGQVPTVALAQLVSDALQHWVAVHTAGLAVSPDAVLTVWLAGGALLALGGLLGARGARVAWPAYGAATVAMAWFGAAEPHRPVAAGLVGLTWAVLSILVLHRGGTRKPNPPVIVTSQS